MIRFVIFLMIMLYLNHDLNTTRTLKQQIARMMLGLQRRWRRHAQMPG